MKTREWQIDEVRNFFAGGETEVVKLFWRSTPVWEQASFIADIQEEALLDWDTLLDPHAVREFLNEV